MRRHLDGRRLLRRRLGTAAAAIAALTVVVTVGVRPSSAAWVSTTTLGNAVGATSSSCTTPGVYRTTASGRYLAGSVAGVQVSDAALAPLTADNPAATATFSAGSTPRGADGATSAVAAASVAAAVPAGAASALTAPAGNQTQFAAATSTGTSVAASGAVTTTGAIDAAGIAAGTRPGAGVLDLDALLGRLSGGSAAAGALSRLRLDIGRTASTATLRECARRWGAPLSSALDRSTAVSSLTLGMRTSSVSGLLAAIDPQRAAVASAFGDVTGGSSTSAAESSLAGTASTGLAGAVNSALSALGSLARAGGVTADVRITTDLSGAATAAAQTTTAASGLVRLDGSSGDVTVDVAGLAGSTTPAPNTDLLTAGDAARIASGVSGAAGTLVAGVGSAWTAAAGSAVITVTASVPVVLAGATIATVAQTTSGTAAQFAAGTETRPAPSVSVLSVLDASALVAALTAPLTSQLFRPVEAAVGSVVAAPLTAAATTARSALATALGTAQTALPGELGALPAVVAVRMNEQPDVAPYPAPAPGTGPAGSRRVTALRVQVLGGRALDLAFASASVGPDRTVNE